MLCLCEGVENFPESFRAAHILAHIQLYAWAVTLHIHTHTHFGKIHRLKCGSGELAIFWHTSKYSICCSECTLSLSVFECVIKKEFKVCTKTTCTYNVGLSTRESNIHWINIENIIKSDFEVMEMKLWFRNEGTALLNVVACNCMRQKRRKNFDAAIIPWNAIVFTAVRSAQFIWFSGMRVKSHA